MLSLAKPIGMAVDIIPDLSHSGEQVHICFFVKGFYTVDVIAKSVFRNTFRKRINLVLKFSSQETSPC